MDKCIGCGQKSPPRHYEIEVEEEGTIYSCAYCLKTVGRKFVALGKNKAPKWIYFCINQCGEAEIFKEWKEFRKEMIKRQNVGNLTPQFQLGFVMVHPSDFPKACEESLRGIGFCGGMNGNDLEEFCRQLNNRVAYAKRVLFGWRETAIPFTQPETTCPTSKWVEFSRESLDYKELREYIETFYEKELIPPGVPCLVVERDAKNVLEMFRRPRTHSKCVIAGQSLHQLKKTLTYYAIQEQVDGKIGEDIKFFPTMKFYDHKKRRLTQKRKRINSELSTLTRMEFAGALPPVEKKQRALFQKIRDRHCPERLPRFAVNSDYDKGDSD